MIDPDKILFIANPSAHHGKALNKIPKIYEVFGESARYEIITTMRPGHATEIARDAKTFGTIVALGGDGTVHEVINGIMERPDDDRPMFSVIPAGSGNDYANALGIPGDAQRALRSLLSRSPRQVDLGTCNGEWFCDSFALGLDARVAMRAIQLRESSILSGFPLYLEALIRTFVKDFVTIEADIAFDGGSSRKTEFLLMATTKGPTYGGGFKITPTSRPDSGHFETCMIAPLSRPGVLWRMAFLAVGKHTGLEKVTMGTHERIRIVMRSPVLGALDGEPRESDVFEVEHHTHALWVK